MALQHLVSSRALCLSGYISGSSATVCSSVSISQHPGLLHDGSFHSSMASHAHVSPCSRPHPGLHLSSSSWQSICLQNLLLLFIALHSASLQGSSALAHWTTLPIIICTPSTTIFNCFIHTHAYHCLYSLSVLVCYGYLPIVCQIKFCLVLPVIVLILLTYCDPYYKMSLPT